MGDNNQAHLKKVLSKWDLLSIGIGAVVGWSWIIYAGIWSSAPGSMGGVIAFVLGGILCSFLGLVYAELTSAMPKAGGDMIFVFEGLGQGWSFIASICITMAFVGLIAVETIMLPVILDALGIPIAKAFELFTFMGESVYLSYILLSVAVNAFFAYLNYRGVALSGIFQSITVVVLLCASVFFVFSGVTLGSVENARPLINNLAGISMVMLMVPSFMAGFNAIAQATEETNVAPRTIGKLIIITVWACVIFYIMIILGLSFAAPESIRGSGGVVVLDAMKNLFNSSTPRLFVAIAALIGMLTSWNAAYLAGSRLLFALGRVGFLPESFSHLSSRHGTPSNAIIAVFVISSLCTIMGTSQGVYVGIIDVLGFCIVVIWFMVSLSFLRLRRTRPEMNRPYKIPAGGFIGGMATILSIVCLLLYTPINPLGGLNTGELIGLGVLACAGIALYYRYIIKGALDEEQRRNILNKSI